MGRKSLFCLPQAISISTVSSRREIPATTATATMLHELLLSLLGYTGDLIIDQREEQESIGVFLSPNAPISEECTFKLAPDISFIQPSERYPLDTPNHDLFLSIFSFSSFSFCTFGYCVSHPLGFYSQNWNNATTITDVWLQTTSLYFYFIGAKKQFLKQKRCKIKKLV